MQDEHDQSTQNVHGEGKLTDELLEKKLHEGKGALSFIPGGEKSEPPVVPQPAPEAGWRQRSESDGPAAL